MILRLFKAQPFESEVLKKGEVICDFKLTKGSTYLEP